MRFILLLLIALLSVSCVTQKACDRKFPPQNIVITKDSIVTRDSIVLKNIEVPVYIKGDTVSKSDTVFITTKPNSKPVFVETSFAKATAQVINGKLTLELTQKDTLFKVEALAKESYYWKEKYKEASSQKVVREKYVPLLYKILSFIGLIALIFIIIRIYVYVRNRI